MANAGFVRREVVMAQSQRPELQVQSQSSSKIDYEHLEISDALKQLGVDPKSSLSDAETKKRLEKYGPNALAEKKISAFEMFGKFFWGPMPWMIEAAAIMSILVKDLVDFIIIMAMLLLNAVLGFWHEKQAASALDASDRALAGRQ
jgi:H+-transporting ATPase